MQENLAEKARRVALEAFAKAGVERKYPIENHLDEIVGDLVKVDANETVIAAGYLHDAPAYTDLSVGVIVEVFGQEVGDLVGEVYAAAVMDIKDNIALRKKLQAERMLTASNGAKAIKIADQRSNILQGFNGQSEGGVSEEKKREYLDGAKAVADACLVGGDDMVKKVYDLFMESYIILGKN